MSSTKQLRLSVWRPLPLQRRVARAGSSPAWQLLPREDIYVEAYRWQLSLDIWGSAPPESVPALRDALIGRFNPFKPPEERGLDKLRETLASYDGVLSEGHTTWRDCEQSFLDAEDDEEGATLRANTIRALRHHLDWVYRTFHAMPLANLTVR